MDKDKLIQGLIDNGAFQEAERPFLKGLTEERLSALSALKKTPTAEEQAAAKKLADESAAETARQELAANKAAEDKAAAEKGKEKPAEHKLIGLADLDPETREAVMTARAALSGQKSKYVGALKVNKRCLFTEAELNAMPVEQLKRLATLAQVEVDFSGNDTGEERQPEGTDDTPEMPVFDFKTNQIVHPGKK